MTARAPVRQVDITRTVRGLAKAGFTVKAVRMDASGATLFLTEEAAGSLLLGGAGQGAAVAETTAADALARLEAMYGEDQDTLLPRKAG